MQQSVATENVTTSLAGILQVTRRRTSDSEGVTLCPYDRAADLTGRIADPKVIRMGTGDSIQPESRTSSPRRTFLRGYAKRPVGIAQWKKLDSSVGRSLQSTPSNRKQKCASHVELPLRTNRTRCSVTT
jgi:hypothetical protein